MELIRSPPTREIVTLDELSQLLQLKSNPKHYIGLEISGRLHLGNSLLIASKLKDLAAAGFRLQILLADYHSWLNRKLGGDLELIRELGLKYYVAAFRELGVDAQFILASQIYDSDYWNLVLKIANQVTLSRILRSGTIMGRLSRELTKLGQLIYPAMQVADIFKLGVDLVHGGMDQRKAHMLARELAPKLGYPKPVALHHELLLGLSPPARLGYESDSELDLRISSKMSKSKPSSCIFIEDSPEQIQAKLRSAYCPRDRVEENPVLEICKLIVFRELGQLQISSPRGEFSFDSYQELIQEYLAGKIHPLDLKLGLAQALSQILEPLRRYFQAHPEPLELLAGAEITR